MEIIFVIGAIINFAFLADIYKRQAKTLDLVNMSLGKAHDAADRDKSIQYRLDVVCREISKLPKGSQ